MYIGIIAFITFVILFNYFFIQFTYIDERKSLITDCYETESHNYNFNNS